MAGIRLDSISKTYSKNVIALSGLTLEIADGEIMVLVGSSGCGKSTALNIIAGLEAPTKGLVSIDGAPVGHLPPAARDVAVVFQNYALYPNMSVYGNMAFALKVRGVAKDVIKSRVQATATLLRLEDVLDRKPRELSGGQRQRVAMGRAIVREPKAFLMDEPLSNLDAALRVQMRVEIAELHQRLGTTMVYVTHDQTEAMTMGSRLAVLDRGVIQQVGSPRDVYEHPANRFVASFVGSPAMNLVNARIEPAEENLVMRIGGDTTKVAETLGPTYRALEKYVGEEVIVGVRSEEAVIREGEGGVGNADRPPVILRGVVKLREELGARVFVYIDLDDVDVMAGPYTGSRGAMVVEVGPRAGVAERDHVVVAIMQESLHFFDCQTGTAIR